VSFELMWAAPRRCDAPRVAVGAALAAMIGMAATVAEAAPARRGVASGAGERRSAVRVSAEITTNGVWLDAGPGVRCFVARKAGAIDKAALESELRQLRGDDRSAIAIAGVRGVTYHEVIAVMDLGVKVGLSDARFGAVDELDAKFDDSAAARKAAATRCPKPRAAPAPAPPPIASDPPLQQLTPPMSDDERVRIKELIERQVPLPPLPVPAKPDYSKTPVIIATRTEITLQGKTVASVAGLADKHGAIQPLLIALEPIARAAPDDHRVILQADESLDVIVIERVCASASAAGLSDVLFAVKVTSRD
jgi:biopolymer transport protein ExbD